MNQKLFAATVSALRKKKGLTQSALAKKLNVSDKAVSKWELGLGYPDVTLFPKIAAEFGVTVDYLMTGERRGIAFVGNIIVDLVKTIDCYPQMGMLATITSITKGVGGSVANLCINFSKIDGSIPLSAVGCIGDDEYGSYVVEQLRRCGVDSSRIAVTDKACTAFTDVMSLSAGERTFFCIQGANDVFSPDHVDIPRLGCSMLHIAYILLMKQFDAPDPEYGTVMARFLHDVQQYGIKTSIDVVSNFTEDYPKKVIPALRYSDNVIINEIECCSIWGLNPRLDDGRINLAVMRDAMERCMACGISERIVVHCKEACFSLNKNGDFTVVPSLDIPSEMIKGSVGAGDSFCAGCLHSIYNGLDDESMLRFASATAVCNLFAENSVDGMRTKEEILLLEGEFGRKSLEDVVG